MSLLEGLDIFRQPSALDAILSACEAIALTRATKGAYNQGRRITRAARLASSESGALLLEKGICGVDLGIALRRARVDALANWLRQFTPSNEPLPPGT